MISLIRKLSLSLIILVSQTLSAPVVPADHRHIIDSAVINILNCRFDDALTLTDKAYQNSSADQNGIKAVAAVLHTAALGMRDVDLDTVFDADAFAASYDRAKTAVDEYEHRGGVSSYSLTLRGFSLAVHAVFHIRRGSYLAAASTGFDAIKAMKEARGLDSANTEVNFFLGLYDYARADLRKRFWWALFWYPGDKESGIRHLEAGAGMEGTTDGSNGAAITGIACALALSDIYLKEKAPQRSRNIIYRLGRELPNSRFVMWAEAKYREDQGMYGQAAKTFGRLADSYEKEAGGDYNAAVTRSKQALMRSKAGGKEAAEAVNTCQYVIERYGNSRDKRIVSIVNDMEKLLGKIGK